MFTYEFISNKNNIFANTAVLILIVALFAILIKNDLILQNIGPSIIFISVVMVLHSIFYHIFQAEYSNGIIEQILLQPIFTPLFITQKLLSHTLFYQIIIMIITPMLGTILHLESVVIYRVILSLVLSIPVIIMISSTIGILAKNNSIIVSVLTLPLLIPISILGNSIIYNIGEYKEVLSLLALIILTLPLNLIAICYFLKVGIENE